MSHHADKTDKEFLDTLLKLIGDFMSTLADNIVLIPALQAQVANLQTELTALKAAVDNLPAAGGSDAATLAAVAGVQLTVNDIDAKLTTTSGA